MAVEPVEAVVAAVVDAAVAMVVEDVTAVVATALVLMQMPMQLLSLMLVLDACAISTLRTSHDSV